MSYKSAVLTPDQLPLYSRCFKILFTLVSPLKWDMHATATRVTLVPPVMQLLSYMQRSFSLVEACVGSSVLDPCSKAILMLLA